MGSALQGETRSLAAALRFCVLKLPSRSSVLIGVTITASQCHAVDVLAENGNLCVFVCFCPKWRVMKCQGYSGSVKQLQLYTILLYFHLKYIKRLYYYQNLYYSLLEFFFEKLVELMVNVFFLLFTVSSIITSSHSWSLLLFKFVLVCLSIRCSTFPHCTKLISFSRQVRLTIQQHKNKEQWPCAV